MVISFFDLYLVKALLIGALVWTISFMAAYVCLFIARALKPDPDHCGFFVKSEKSFSLTTQPQLCITRVPKICACLGLDTSNAHLVGVV